MSGINYQVRKDLKLAAAASTGVTLAGGNVFPTLTKGHELVPTRKQRINMQFILNPTASSIGAAGGMGQKIFTLPEGFAYMKAVVASFNIVTAGSATGAVWSLGSVACAQDATLTGTEADLLASQTLGDGTIAAATAEVQSTVHAILDANKAQDASAAAKDIYFNVAGTWTHASLNPLPVTVAGYIDIVWQYLGDD